MKKEMVLGLASLFIVPVAVAEMYRWTDDSGNVVYSESPPANREFTVIKAPPPPASRSPEELAAEEAERESVLAQDPAVRRERCDNARSNLALLKNAKAGEQFKTADGQEISFSAEQLAASIRENEVAEKAYCD